MVERQERIGKNNEETGQRETELDRVCAVVKTSRRGGSLFLGWTKGDLPIAVSDERDISDAGKKSLELSRISGQEAYYIKLRNITPVEFSVSKDPFDLKDDPDDGKKQDILTLSVRDENGKSIDIYTKELDLLDAIVDSRVRWQDISSDTIYAEDVIPAKEMYSVFIPDSDPMSNKTYAMLFRPTMKNESNEPAFRRFLNETIARLVMLDRKQNIEDKKGYEKAYRNRRSGTGSAEGGFAYKLFRVLKDYELIRIPSRQLERLRDDSDKQGLIIQLTLIARELGYLEYTPRKKPLGGQKQLARMTTEQLIGLINFMRDAAKASF